MNVQPNTVKPQAREALNQFKHEVASEIGVPLKQGYNGARGLGIGRGGIWGVLGFNTLT